MKHTLLLLFFFALTTTAFSQIAFNPRADIKRPTDKLEVQVYPNPTTDYFNLTDNEVVEKITVYTLLGREIKRFNYVKGEKYRVEELPRGMYLVQLTDRNGRIINTQRVSKR
ncbi:MAG: T9SS type A sorting domain-containing protein [Saprospiraceae bacterium]|nr:T9SS type A sorting domain-containing protein [Saprospiraceae bacterium]